MIESVCMGVTRGPRPIKRWGNICFFCGRELHIFMRICTSFFFKFLILHRFALSYCTTPINHTIAGIRLQVFDNPGEIDSSRRFVIFESQCPKYRCFFSCHTPGWSNFYLNGWICQVSGCWIPQSLPKHIGRSF